MKFKHGDRVRTTGYQGCYKNATGRVVNYLTMNRVISDPTGFVQHSNIINDMYRVVFDAPVNISTDPENVTTVAADVFPENHLALI